ncbi:unnamed protein product [Lota lota]
MTAALEPNEADNAQGRRPLVDQGHCLSYDCGEPGQLSWHCSRRDTLMPTASSADPTLCRACDYLSPVGHVKDQSLPGLQTPNHQNLLADYITKSVEKTRRRGAKAVPPTTTAALPDDEQTEEQRNKKRPNQRRTPKDKSIRRRILKRLYEKLTDRDRRKIGQDLHEGGGDGTSTEVATAPPALSEFTPVRPRDVADESLSDVQTAVSLVLQIA